MLLTRRIPIPGAWHSSSRQLERSQTFEEIVVAMIEKPLTTTRPLPFAWVGNCGSIYTGWTLIELSASLPGADTDLTDSPRNHA